MTPHETAAVLYEALGPFLEQPVIKRLRLRLRQLGKNVQDETEQFRLLQRAAREEPELAAALESAGLGDITKMAPTGHLPEIGVVVQGFNHLVEQHWEGW